MDLIYIFATLYKHMPGLKQYHRLALLHLLLIAILGFFLRLKLEVPMPWLNQKYLLNGHSHFAFIAWVSFFAMLNVVKNVYGNSPWPKAISRFFNYYIVNSWAMLIAFVVSGYGPISMFLLAFHVVLCVWFTKWWIFSDKRELNRAAVLSISWALFFNLLSFVGTVYLGYLLATKSGTLYTKQNAIYIFLHYQYNGYFLFASLGLFLQFLKPQTWPRILNYGIWLYAIGTLTGLGLLILMREKPLWLNMINIVTACILGFSTYVILPIIIKEYKKVKFTVSNIARSLIFLSLCGLILKTSLQILSALPEVAYMVYEHRSIAIGYLHLIFLIIVTFLFLGLLLSQVQLNKRGQISLYIFVAATIINEVVLGLQGLGAIIHILVPYTNIILIVLTGLMAISMGVMLGSYRKILN